MPGLTRPPDTVSHHSTPREAVRSQTLTPPVLKDEEQAVPCAGGGEDAGAQRIEGDEHASVRLPLQLRPLAFTQGS